MPKFFVFSDVHGYFTELKTALDEAGYDPLNEDHWLISCGDNFDRGTETLKMFHFLLKSPRLITVKGNHEDLFESLCDNGAPGLYDKSNGTYDTVRAFNKEAPFDVACYDAARSTRKLFSNMRNYFETENYVFVHGWIPTEYNIYTGERFIPNYWRDYTTKEWEKGRWMNGIDNGREGIILSDKTIVCGHWNCSYGHYKDMYGDIPLSKTEEMIFLYGEQANHNPYYNRGIIAIDACTPASKKVNVIVLEDDFIKEEI